MASEGEILTVGHSNHEELDFLDLLRGAGVELLAGGAPEKRMALPNSKILIHQVSGGFSGQATDIEIHAKEIIDVRQRLDEIISKHT